MNFVKLVEDGTYTKKMLDEKEQAYINAFDDVQEEAENFLSSNYDVDEAEDTLEKIKCEIAEEVISDFVGWLEATKCERLVEMVDNKG